MLRRQCTAYQNIHIVLPNYDLSEARCRAVYGILFLESPALVMV